MVRRQLSRPNFLAVGATASLLPDFHRLAESELNRIKIRDVRTTTIQGPSRTYVLVKLLADDGIYIGVNEQVLSMNSSTPERSGFSTCIQQPA